MAGDFRVCYPAKAVKIHVLHTEDRLDQGEQSKECGPRHDAKDGPAKPHAVGDDRSRQDDEESAFCRRDRLLDREPGVIRDQRRRSQRDEVGCEREGYERQAARKWSPPEEIDHRNRNRQQVKYFRQVVVAERPGNNHGCVRVGQKHDHRHGEGCESSQLSCTSGGRSGGKKGIAGSLVHPTAAAATTNSRFSPGTASIRRQFHSCQLPFGLETAATTVCTIMYRSRSVLRCFTYATSSSHFLSKTSLRRQMWPGPAIPGMTSSRDRYALL